MSRENVEIVRSIHEAWELGDYTSVEWAHPEIECVLADGPNPEAWRGLAGMAKAWREFLSAFEGLRIEVDEYRDVDAERVLVLVHKRGRGKASGVDVGHIGTRGASVFHIRGGKVTRLVLYFDGERAVADLGLASENDLRE
jgi:ketosteroid isomerase-like protein